jgi:hypothetical protein
MSFQGPAKGAELLLLLRPHHRYLEWLKLYCRHRLRSRNLSYNPLLLHGKTHHKPVFLIVPLEKL